MPATAEVALAHAAQRRKLVLDVADDARDVWRKVNPSAIAQSWSSQIPRLMVVLTGAQRIVAGKADQYLGDVLDAQHLSTRSTARTVPAALAGVASDGRTLDTLLYQPAIATLLGIQQGQGVPRALASGQAVLDMIVRTQVADAGRVADQVATTTHPQATGYVRMLVGRSCSRCAILAGRWYRYNAGFKRHPRCDCVGIPGRESIAGDLTTDPKVYFNSLSASDQDRVFTKAGAQSIRLGADIGKVVNARRGMATADVLGRKVHTTTEARGRRSIRLMPETILREAKSRDDALRLLKLHGYLV
jgi:hypothetical protein